MYVPHIPYPCCPHPQFNYEIIIYLVDPSYIFLPAGNKTDPRLWEIHLCVTMVRNQHLTPPPFPCRGGIALWSVPPTTQGVGWRVPCILSYIGHPDRAGYWRYPPFLRFIASNSLVTEWSTSKKIIHRNRKHPQIDPYWEVFVIQRILY